MPDSVAMLSLQDLVARFANSLDLKDWERLGQCLTATLHTDYSDLRGTPPETVSRKEFVELRQAALEELETHHLAGQSEIDVTEPTANMTVSMVIYRRNSTGKTLNTHCIYFFGAVKDQGTWQIASIRQKVLMSHGDADIHKGIVRP